MRERDCQAYFGPLRLQLKRTLIVGRSKDIFTQKEYTSKIEIIALATLKRTSYAFKIEDRSYRLY